MVDPNRDTRERARNHFAPDCEPSRPFTVIRNHFDRVEALAAFSHLESRPERRRDRTRQSLPFFKRQLVRFQSLWLADKAVQVDYRRARSLDLVQTKPGHHGVSIGRYPCPQQTLGQTWSGQEFTSFRTVGASGAHRRGVKYEPLAQTVRNSPRSAALRPPVPHSLRLFEQLHHP